MREIIDTTFTIRPVDDLNNHLLLALPQYLHGMHSSYAIICNIRYTSAPVSEEATYMIYALSHDHHGH